MTPPRASLLRLLSWWLRGGPARLSARIFRHDDIPRADAAILGWCVMANSTIVLMPVGFAVAVVLGFLRGRDGGSPRRLALLAQEPRP